jgi:hypothetical protein
MYGRRPTLGLKFKQSSVGQLFQHNICAAQQKWAARSTGGPSTGRFEHLSIETVWSKCEALCEASLSNNLQMSPATLAFENCGHASILRMLTDCAMHYIKSGNVRIPAATLDID